MVRCSKAHLAIAITLALVFTGRAAGQAQAPGSHQYDAQSDTMPGMDMGGTPPSPFISYIEQHATSGTSAEPNSTPMPMLMTERAGWMLMFHGVGFLNVQQQ